MDGRGTPKNAKSLTDLLKQQEQWKQEVSSFFVATRAASNLSQSSFAATLSISQPYLSQIERGERTPSSGTLSKLRSFVEGEEDGNRNQE